MSQAKNALIIGASRGLGLGLVKTLLGDGWQVTATVRNPSNAEALQALGDVRIEKLDMDDQQAVIALSQQLKGELSTCCSSMPGSKARQYRPRAARPWRKSVSCFSPTRWRRSIWRNALPDRSAMAAVCWRS
jgi:NAD(P)-dependent dehydrogenase (short-subunit alcohol dehydrogenase family)